MQLLCRSAQLALVRTDGVWSGWLSVDLHSFAMEFPQRAPYTWRFTLAFHSSWPFGGRVLASLTQSSSPVFRL
jgi:hypothetical protein